MATSTRAKDREFFQQSNSVYVPSKDESIESYFSRLLEPDCEWPLEKHLVTKLEYRKYKHEENGLYPGHEDIVATVSDGRGGYFRLQVHRLCPHLVEPELVDDSNAPEPAISVLQRSVVHYVSEWCMEEANGDKAPLSIQVSRLYQARTTWPPADNLVTQYEFEPQAEFPLLELAVILRVAGAQIPSKQVNCDQWCHHFSVIAMKIMIIRYNLRKNREVDLKPEWEALNGVAQRYLAYVKASLEVPSGFRSANLPKKIYA